MFEICSYCEVFPHGFKRQVNRVLCVKKQKKTQTLTAFMKKDAPTSNQQVGQGDLKFFSQGCSVQSLGLSPQQTYER